MRREFRKRFPRHSGLAIPTCITTRVDACRDRQLVASFEVGGGESIPGACATRNFTYLVRGPCSNTVNELKIKINNRQIIKLDTMLDINCR